MMNKVLIVESDMDRAISIGIFLGRRSFHPVFAFSVREAWAEIYSQKPVLICISRRLRGGTGDELLEEIRKQGYAMPVVMLPETKGGDELFFFLIFVLSFWLGDMPLSFF